MSADEDTGASQLRRPPRGSWRVATRCSYGYPTVIATPSMLASGEPFPTLFWLTCPHLVDAVGRLESSGEVEAWATRLAEDPALATSMRAADGLYRAARADESGGADACPTVGIAGQRDPLATKCLHAHVATALAGIADPGGESILCSIERECRNERCAGESGDPGE